MSVNGGQMPGADRVSLPELADWAGEAIRRGQA